MKKYILLLLIVITASSFMRISFTEIITAIKTGDAREVAKYLDNSVEITLSEKSNSYSKRQAELVLRDFFANNPVKGFDVIHQSENSSSQYCIGNLNTSNGSFRTTIFVKQKGDKQLIQELRFEK